MTYAAYQTDPYGKGWQELDPSILDGTRMVLVPAHADLACEPQRALMGETARYIEPGKGAGKKGRKGRNPGSRDKMGIGWGRRLRPITGRNGQKPSLSALEVSKTTFGNCANSCGTPGCGPSGR
jgi:hypothetical protein